MFFNFMRQKIGGSSHDGSNEEGRKKVGEEKIAEERHGRVVKTFNIRLLSIACQTAYWTCPLGAAIINHCILRLFAF